MRIWFFVLALLHLPLMGQAYEVGGKVDLFSAEMPEQSTPDVTRYNGGVDLKPFWGWKPAHSNWSLHLEPWLRLDALTQSSEEKTTFEPHEIVISWKHKSQVLKLGFATVNWEGTDVFNPMDIVHAKNLRDPLQQENRASAGVFYGNQWGAFSWDILFIPVASRTLLPGQQSPWWPRQFQLPTLTPSQELLLPMNVDYHVNSDEVLNHADQANSGLRLQYHGGSWDFSAAAFDGLTQIPSLFPEVTVPAVVEISPLVILQLANPIVIQPIYYRNRIVAGAIVWTEGAWIFRLSDQYAQPESDDSRVPGYLHSGVIAIERTFNLGDKAITIVAEAMASQHPPNSGVSLLSNIRDKSFLVGSRVQLSENWLLTLGALQEQISHSGYSTASLSWSVTGSWKLEASGNYFFGNDNSTLGLFRHNRNLQLVSTLSF